MNTKRLVAAIVLVLLALFLLYPDDYSYIRFHRDVVNLLKALIPIFLVGYGVLTFKKTYSNISEYGDGEDDIGKNHHRKEDGFTDFENGKEWEAKGDWKGRGNDIWQGKIEDNRFMMKEDVESSHYAKKFQDKDFDSVEINLEIPDKSDVYLEVGTGDDEEAIRELDVENLRQFQKIELNSGKNNPELDLDWGKYTVFKVVLHRFELEVPSPQIKNIHVEVEDKNKTDEGVEEQKEESSLEDKGEEMPEFEDVEYKDLECPECGEDFKTDIGLKVHRKVNHPDEFEKNPGPEVE